MKQNLIQLYFKAENRRNRLVVKKGVTAPDQNLEVVNKFFLAA